MANGRFLSKTVANSVQLANLSDQAESLFFRMIPHLDRDGRLEGDPLLVKAIAAPLKASLSLEWIPVLLHELAEAKDADGEGLVQWYVAKGKKVLQFPGFGRSQQGLRTEREAASRLPAFDQSAVVMPAPVPLSAGTRRKSGAGPEPVRSRTRVRPEGRPHKLSEVQVEVEVEGKGPADAGSGTPRGGWPAHFTELLKPIGLFKVPRVGQALLPLVEEYGLERAEEMTRAYAQSAPHLDRNGQVDPEINTPHFCTPEKLAQTARFWHDYTAPIATNRGA